MEHIVTEGEKDIPPDELVWLKDHPYPFYFRRTNENGKPVLYGDFSSGQLGKKGFIESEVEWENVIWPIPEDKKVKSLQELHDWVESKTFFKEKADDEIGLDDKFILSRYCKHCGKTETFHGTKGEWVETGYIKICEPPAK